MTEFYNVISIVREFLSKNLPSIVSITSLIIAYFAWRETTRVRKSSFHPDIIIPPSNVFLEITCSDSNESQEWSTRFFGMKEKEKYFNHATSVYPINIGLGVAKEIEIEFIYDLKQMVKSIEKLKHPIYQLIYTKHGNDVEIITLGTKLDMNQTFDSESKIDIGKDILDYLLPNHQVQNQNQYSILPDSFLKMYFYYIISKYNALDDNREDFYVDNFEGFSLPKLEIKYRDVQNNIHRKRFMVKLSAYDTLLVGKKENEVSFYLSLEYKEFKN